MPTLRALFDLSRPLHLLLFLLNVGLGAGISHYLGQDLNLQAQALGAVALLFLLIACNLLTEYFRPAAEQIYPFHDDRKARHAFRSTLLTVACAFLLVALAAFFVIDSLTPLAWGLFGLFVLLGLSVALPPIQLETRGFAEVIQAFLLSMLAPALVFALQTGELHRIVHLFTFPLFLLALAALIAMRFPRYADDLKHHRITILSRLTWERAVALHNGLLVCAYLWIACLSFFDIPFALVWPGLLTLPFAGTQFYLLQRISDGYKPLWNPLIVSSLASFGLTASLFTLTFWLR